MGIPTRRLRLLLSLVAAAACGENEDPPHDGGSSTFSTSESSDGGDGTSGGATGTQDAGNATTGGMQDTGDDTTGAGTTTSNAETTGGELQCDPDVNEPNDGEDAAKNLGQIGDGDGEGSMIQGVLEGTDDVDWFTYHGADNFGAVVDPTRTVTAQGTISVCKYLVCDSDPAATVVPCPQGTNPSLTGSGIPGCCATNVGFTIALDCPGSDDSATVLIQLLTDDDACVPYSLGYHY